MVLPRLQLLFNILLLGQTRLQFQHCALEFNSHLLIPLESQLKFIDLELVCAPLLFHLQGQSSDFSVLLNSELLHLASQIVQVDLILLINATDFFLELAFSSGILSLSRLKLSEMCFLLGRKSLLHFFKLSQEAVLLFFCLSSMTLLEVG